VEELVAKLKAISDAKGTGFEERIYVRATAGWITVQ